MALIDAERAVFSIKRGDTWRRRWLVTEGDVSAWDQSTLLVQVRSGVEEAPLVASSDPADVEGDVVAIDVSGSNLSATPAVLEFAIAAEDTTAPGFTPGAIVRLEAQVEISGDLITFLSRTVIVESQVAIQRDA
jgi:hypothetical protein